MFRLILIASLLCSCTLSASDWPQILGPNRNGIYEGGLADDWPISGPETVWKMNVGEGFAGPVVADGKLILFHRIDDQEMVEARDAKTGTPIWKQGYSTSYRDMFGFDHGPRAIPTISDKRITTMGAQGMVQCLDLKDGKRIWQSDLGKEHAAETGFFGLACSPLVDGGRVFLNVGGKNGAGIVCLSSEDGSLLWKATNQEASYSSPAMANLAGGQTVLIFAREGLVGLNPINGTTRFEFRWRARIRESVNAATPVVKGNRIFITASYDTGGVLLDASGASLTSVWRNDKSLSSQYATPVMKDGFLYGLHGRHDFPTGPVVRCAAFATGEVKWSSPAIKPANVMLADGHLLILCETGQLIRAKATSDEFMMVNRAQILGTTVRAYPALADGRFYARDKQRLVCVDLNPQ